MTYDGPHVGCGRVEWTGRGPIGDAAERRPADDLDRAAREEARREISGSTLHYRRNPAGGQPRSHQNRSPISRRGCGFGATGSKPVGQSNSFTSRGLLTAFPRIGFVPYCPLGAGSTAPGPPDRGGRFADWLRSVVPPRRRIDPSGRPYHDGMQACVRRTVATVHRLHKGRRRPNLRGCEIGRAGRKVWKEGLILDIDSLAIGS